MRRSPLNSGWNADAMRWPCRARTMRTLYRESSAQSPHVRRMDGDRLALLAVLLHRTRDRVDMFAHVALDPDDADSHLMDLGAVRIKTISTVLSGTANRRGVQLFSCSWFRGFRNSSCRISANAAESRRPRRWLATLLMTTSSPACGESRGRNTSSPSGNTAPPIGDRLSASGWRSSSGTTSKNRSRSKGRRTRPSTVTRTRSVDGSSDVVVSSASRLMPTWNGSSSTDMPPNRVTYQCRNVSTGKAGAGLPGAPRLRSTDGKLPAALFVMSVSKIRVESTLCRNYSTRVISSFVAALDILIYNTYVRRKLERLPRTSNSS